MPNWVRNRIIAKDYAELKKHLVNEKGITMKLKKNEVIIDDVSFYIHNINGNGVNVYVHAYAQDVTEYDTYTADIYIVNEFHETEKLHSTLHFDSSGNINEEQPKLDEIENAVLDVLFINRQHGIIREF